MGGNFIGYDPAAHYLRKISDPFKKSVGNTWSSPGTPCNFLCPFIGYINIQDGSGPFYYQCQFFRCIELHTEYDTKSIPQWCCQCSRPGSRPHQGKRWKIETIRSGPGSFPHDDIQSEILHGRIEDFFYRTIQSVNFVNKKHIMFFQISKEGCQISRTFNGRTAGNPEINPQFIGNDVCHSSFPQSRWSIKEHMVQRFLSLLSCLNIYRKILTQCMLTYII